SIQVSPRVQCDLELLATGAFSPLDRFLGRADHERVEAEMRLANGTLWPMPITLPVANDAPVSLDREMVLRSATNEILAVMTVEEIYEVTGTRNVSGRLRVLALPTPPDFRELRLTPAEVRAKLEELGHSNVVAFQTRNPMHRAHEELTKRAIDAVGGTLLLHPAVGLTKPGDVDHYTRVRIY